MVDILHRGATICVTSTFFDTSAKASSKKYYGTIKEFQVDGTILIQWPDGSDSIYPYPMASNKILTEKKKQMFYNNLRALIIKPILSKKRKFRSSPFAAPINWSRSHSAPN